jgi:hypothetical protein
MRFSWECGGGVEQDRCPGLQPEVSPANGF